MKIGDLVRHLKSEGGMLGIIVGWHRTPPSIAPKPCPVVLWMDGRKGWVMPHLVSPYQQGLS